MTTTEYELISELRAQCREIEVQQFETEIEFKYTARTFWWKYLQASQYFTRYVMPFREFWDNDSTYPRTIK